MAEKKPTKAATPKSRSTASRKKSTPAANSKDTEANVEKKSDNTPKPEPEVAGSDHRTEAKSRFNAALTEARAGAAALGAEARERAGKYTEGAKSKSASWQSEARDTASGLAVDGKARASEALSGLSRLIDEKASSIDEKLGQKYGDYARTASRSVKGTADRLNERSVEELGEDAREYVRNNPGKSVAMAALAGYVFARLFRR